MQDLLISWIVALYRNHLRPPPFIFFFIFLSLFLFYLLVPGYTFWCCVITIDASFSWASVLNVIALLFDFIDSRQAHKVSINLICYGCNIWVAFLCCRKMLPLRNTCSTCGTTLCPKQQPRMSSSWPTAMEACLSLSWWVFEFSAYPSYLPPARRQAERHSALLSARSHTWSCDTQVWTTKIHPNTHACT